MLAGERDARGLEQRTDNTTGRITQGDLTSVLVDDNVLQAVEVTQHTAPLGHVLENGSFLDDSVDWMDTPEGQQSIEALDLVFGVLDHVDVDARKRKIVWTDGKRLSIEEVAERLHAEHPDMPRDLIETHVFGLLENCVPEILHR